MQNPLFRLLRLSGQSVSVFLIGIIIRALGETGVQKRQLVNITARIRRDIFTQLHRLPVSYFKAHHSGDTLSRMTNDVNAAVALLGEVPSKFLFEIFTCLAAATIIFWVDYRLGIIAVAAVGLGELANTKAAKAASAYDFIFALEHGFDTHVGEKGTQLSGGKKERIAIARSVLCNAPILLLDEATASLDAGSEASVHAALDNLMQERTVIVVAHRLSTIENADRIVVLSGGRVVEEGSHPELLSLGGLYYELQQTADRAKNASLEAAG